jgi:6-phosphofructokinase 1
MSYIPNYGVFGHIRNSYMGAPSLFTTDPAETEIESLGTRTINSPLHHMRFVGDESRIVYDASAERLAARLRDTDTILCFEEAGPREKLFFDPLNVKAAIVTCGGICPGLNDVIRSIVHTLTFGYGVRIIKGIQYGFSGLNPKSQLPLRDLTPDVVRSIHEDGGTFLGSSRGPQPVDVMVDTLYREDIRLLFAIGGDGTLRGADEIHNEVKARDMSLAVIGIPKTIDNDIGVVSRTFGFDTAVSTAVDSLRAAHVEARGAINGVGIVKLMGRNAGFVAAHAALAAADANFGLVPEVPFDLDGPKGFLAALEKRLAARGHALVVVAEGAGQNLIEGDRGADASGNVKLGDIGVVLKTKIKEHLTERRILHSIKYIDPSYTIRSVPANANDRIFCGFLGQHAAHAGMAGKTGLLIGSWNNLFIHVPLELAVRKHKQIDPEGIIWTSVLEATGQPSHMTND